MSKLNWWKTSCAVFLLCAATAIGLRAQTLTTLYDFDEIGQSTGTVMPSPLIQGTDGNLYGTTAYGGRNHLGSVFKITPDGKLTTLYSFCPQTGCTDGLSPFAPMVQATDGNFYGTTWLGGANDQGTIFKITSGGKLMTFYSFCSEENCTDGAQPVGGLVEGTDGNLYGTTASGGGGTETCNFTFNSCGTVFKITLGASLTTLHDFDRSDGGNPGASLV